MELFLRATSIMDRENSRIRESAQALANRANGPLDVAKRCFEWVRDVIRHSHDYQLNPVTCVFEVRISSGSSRIPKNSGGRGRNAALRNAPNSSEFGYAELRRLASHPTYWIRPPARAAPRSGDQRVRRQRRFRVQARGQFGRRLPRRMGRPARSSLGIARRCVQRGRSPGRPARHTRSTVVVTPEAGPLRPDGTPGKLASAGL